MKITKLLALLMVLVLAVSMFACDKNDDGDSPDTTSAMTAEDVIDVLKGYFSNVDDINLSGTSEVKTTENGTTDTEVTEIVMQIEGLKSASPNMYVEVSSEEEATTNKIIYVDGIMYMEVDFMGTPMKVKRAVDKEEATAEYADIGSVFPYDTAALVKTSIEYKDGNCVMTVTGLSRDEFIKNVLLIDRENFTTDDEYQDAVAEYEFDSEKDFIMVVTVNSKGKLVSVETTEKYTYNGTVIENYDVVNVSYDKPNITVPKDADEYTDMSDFYG